MRFVVLVKANKDSEAGVLPTREMFEAMGAFNERLAADGILLAGDGLRPTSKGTRLRFDGARTTITDGPFAETKELVAGFCIIQVTSRQEAIDWVKRWPPLDGDVELEIRQIFEAEDFGAEFTPELRAAEDRMRVESAAHSAKH